MKKTAKLAFSFLREHPVRFVLTTAATAAAVCMVIWIASSYEALHQTYDEYANLALGRYELAIAPISMKSDDYVPEEALIDLRQDSDIAAVDPMWAKRLRVRHTPSNDPSRTTENHSDNETHDRNGVNQNQFADGPGSGPNARKPEMLFLATDAPEPPFEMLKGRWLDSASDSEVVVRSDVAEKRGIELEDRILVELERPKSDGEKLVSLRVIGIMNAPSLPSAGANAIPVLAPSSGEVFLSIAVAKKIFQETKRISLLGVSLAPSTDIHKFRFRWSPRLSRYSTPVQFQEAYAIEEAFDQAEEAKNVRSQSYMATAVAMLVALLVTSCTLSMGVTERARQYALLRAITLTRRQVGALIVIEALILGTTGFLGGLLLGLLVLQSSQAAFSKLLYHGLPFGTHSMTLALIAAYAGTLLASIVPSWRAMRVRPIDAMAPPQMHNELRISKTMAIAGLFLVALNPFLTFAIPQTERSIIFSMAIGYAAMMLGFLLLAPVIVTFVDRWLSPLFAWAFGIDPKLLASQITAHLWRTVGAAVAMAFGMGLFIGIQVWGFTMLQAFIPGTWVPDAIIALKPGLPADDVAKIADIPAIDSDRCLPLVVEQPRLWEDITGSAERPSVTRQDSVIIVGLDPDRAFGGPRALLNLEWMEGSAAHAIQELQEKRACIVPDHFLKETGLATGDTIELVPPNSDGKPVEYTIAGAVRLPGWHWQTKLTGMRPRTHRAAALVFANYFFVSRDFDLPNASHVWFSYADQNPDIEQIRHAVENLYPKKHEDSESAMMDSGSTVRVIPVQSIRDHIQQIARRWIWLISQVPLIALLISCLGVLNVLLASVRSRRWEFGVLRAIGFTRSELVRAVLAEGLLIASTACFLSLGFGILAGWCGSGVAQYVSFFGGLNPPLVIPTTAIALGMQFVLCLGIASAVWPAMAIGKARPLTLLQHRLVGF